ncbi:MAG: RNA polymerase sigma factor [Oscillospiraceae bacterium]|nr:RNA polymerase sigma factor [Oscillospiraceae bacterium]
MDDEQIVNLYWQRSPQAIELTEVKYGAYCRSVALRICQNREDAEECVNDTWLSAWNAMPDKRPERLSPFLCRICRNHALDLVEKRGRQKRGGSESALALEELEECLPSEGSAETALLQKELKAAVKRFISSLPEAERRVFLARYFFLMPLGEIAKRGGFRLSKVKSMLFRTRKKLRIALEKEGYV